MRPKTPSIAADTIIEFEGGIVLVERKFEPLGWAIPGGFVDIGESVEDAATREAKEETNLDVSDLKQFHTYSEASRDPRGHTVSIVFTAKGFGELKGLDDAKQAKVFNKDNLPELAFDHKKILEDYFNGKRR
jgi:8-oxo-dGTP diphosphatase